MQGLIAQNKNEQVKRLQQDKLDKIVKTIKVEYKDYQEKFTELYKLPFVENRIIKVLQDPFKLKEIDNYIQGKNVSPDQQMDSFKIILADAIRKIKIKIQEELLDYAEIKDKNIKDILIDTEKFYGFQSECEQCCKPIADNSHEEGDDDDVAKGIGDYINNEPSFWNRYAKSGLAEVLKLRLEASEVDLSVIKIVSPEYVWLDSGSPLLLNQIVEIVNQFAQEKILIPLNLYHKHWVGLVIEKMDQDIKLIYMDSEQQAMPIGLKGSLIELLKINCVQQNIELVEAKVEMQSSNNCGPEVVENFMFYLTGHRFTQAEAVQWHSRLYELKLLAERPVMITDLVDNQQAEMLSMSLVGAELALVDSSVVG